MSVLVNQIFLYDNIYLLLKMGKKIFNNKKGRNNSNKKKNFSKDKHNNNKFKQSKKFKPRHSKKENKRDSTEETKNKNDDIINIDEINERSEENESENNNENNQEIKEKNNNENDNKKIKEKKEENKKEEIKKKQNDENMKEIFIRNIGYSTSEEKLKELFTQIIPEKSIEFCLLCKDKETHNSKGSAFIKLTKESYNKVMSLYKDYSTKKRNFNEMNPFELDGRYLKLFDAMTREELKNLEKDKEKKNSKRNKTYLYYGLSKETISKFKEFEKMSEKDNEKRERLIQIKKENFYSNPNFHVSETRISFRNLDKNIDENILKEKINEVLEADENIKKEYKNMKLIKQIKLLKEEDDKSKCVAFVECLNFNVAKFLIDNLSGIILNEKSQKGLIIDFSLDDFRKKFSREKKLERIKQIKKQIKMERREKRRNEKREANKNENNENKVELKDITDINKLIDLYHTTMSRGKKQRIKKKLKNLGYNKDIPPVEINQNKNSINLKEENDNKMNSNDDYVKIKISNNRTELNKKMKNKIKQNKKENNKNDKNKDFINKKRERDNKGFGEDENIQRKKKKKQNKELNITKNIINERMDYINKNKNNKNFDNDDDNDPDMQKYYDKIEQQLSKNK